VNSIVKRRRRWFRFKLATLFVAIAVLAALLAMYCRAQKQARAINAISSGGAYVVLESSAPPWIQALLGKQYCSRVVEATIDPAFSRWPEESSRVTDDQLKPLADFPHLESLHIGPTFSSYAPECQITDAGLKHLRRLRKLRELHIREAPHLTDACLEYLADLHQLEVLELMGTQVTDAGITKLRQALPNLKVIRSDVDENQGVVGPEAFFGSDSD
jgi:hypothetical protein